ncbi:MAG: methyltransferase domain-containing protein [Anaerolineae bacterium]|nr:methyltransferase domain-containing protein [Anaerolineae bacterium]
MKPDSIFGNANAYEGYVGRWSLFVAQRFVAWLGIPPGGTWLDVGAGTGIMTQVILQEASPAKVIGVDLSPEYIEFARQRIQDERVEFRVGDAAQITAESAAFDAAVAGLVLNFVPAPDQVAQNMVQAVRNGGMVAAYVWDYGGRMEMMRQFWDAAIQIDPSAREMDAGQRFAICDPNNLRALFQSVGLEGVAVMPIDIETPFKDFDDFWLPFLGAQGSVSKYLHGLSDETRNAIRDQLRRQLPTLADGVIPLMARAWAVKGKKAAAG